jgi:hypothetical protein
MNGGDIYRTIERPPYNQVAVDDHRLFLQFNHMTQRDGQLFRVMGWAHPTLKLLLKAQSSSLFFDGTFKCVPLPFMQCLILMVYDNTTDLYVPVFYMLVEKKTEWSYWDVLNYVLASCDLKLGT